MALRVQEMRNTTARAGSSQPRASISVPPISFHSVAYIVTALLALLAIYAIMGNVMGWGRSRLDDFRYGTTRTFQTDEIVGRRVNQAQSARGVRSQRFAAHAERKRRQHAARQGRDPAVGDESCFAGILKEARHHREFALDAQHLIREPRGTAAERPVLRGRRANVEVEERGAAAKLTADERRDEEVGARVHTSSAQKHSGEQKDAAERRERGQGT